MKTYQAAFNWSLRPGCQLFLEWLDKYLRGAMFIAEHNALHDGHRANEVIITEIEFVKEHWDIELVATATAERTCCKMAREIECAS